MRPSCGIATWVFLAPTSAHRQCTSCIPLGDLLSEAYGIEIAVDKLSSAAAFHNGSMTPLSSLDASPEYVTLMRSILDQEIDREPQTRVYQCAPQRSSPPLSDFDASFLEFLLACLRWIQRLWQPAPPPPGPEPLHPTAQLIRTHLQRLPPFATMSPTARAQAAVGLQLPAWLVGSAAACHIATAAAQTFGRVLSVETSPSAAFTAAGYELCRVAHDAFACTGPGRLMTLEADGPRVVAAVVATPLAWWAPPRVAFAVRAGLAPPALVDWVDRFVDAQRPDRIMLVGAEAEAPWLRRALGDSRAAPLLEGQRALPPRWVRAMGAAQAAKDALESQPDDCGEPPECEELRRRADAIAGVYRPLKPATWPAGGLRHREL